MRFRGGGVGHTSTQDATNRFLTDHHPTDVQHHGPHDGPEEQDNDEITVVPELEEAHDNQHVDDETLADAEDDEAEDDYGYSRDNSDDNEDEGEEGDGQPENEDEEDEVKQLGFARF